MATINAYLGLNMINPSVWYGQVTKATSTEIVISDGYSTGVYYGHGFAYNGYTVVAGTLTGYATYVGGYLAGDMSGFAVPASLAAYYINTNQLAPFLAFVLDGNDTINGSAFADRLAGYSGTDIILAGGGNDDVFGDAGNDHLHGGLGRNYLDGGFGLDRAYYDGAGGDYSYALSGGAISIWSWDGAVDDYLVSIERLEFANGTLAFDLNGNAGQGYRIYQAAFDRQPDTSGLSYWVDQLDAGMTLYNVALSFIGSDEFRMLYGSNPSNEDFVELLYQNVLNRNPDTGGYDYWTVQMDEGLTRADMLIAFSESLENKANVSAAIEDGIWLI